MIESNPFLVLKEMKTQTNKRSKIWHGSYFNGLQRGLLKKRRPRRRSHQKPPNRQFQTFKTYFFSSISLTFSLDTVKAKKLT